MYLSIAALAASLACVQAFKDTSPFILFSSSPLPETLKDVSKAQVQSRAQVLATTKEFLKSCPSDIYYIHTQPQISSSLLRSHSPHLQNALSHPSVKTKYVVSEVPALEARDGGDLAELLRKECGTEIKDVIDARREGPVVIWQTSDSKTTSRTERIARLEDADSSLYTDVLGGLNTVRGKGYTVIYLSTPVQGIVEEGESVYEAVFTEVVHMDLKRELGERKGNKSEGTPDVRPLFEKYTFLSPGLFMGLLVAFILLTILYVGISGVSSLEVSYGAFDKEMGPAVHKKQQ